MLLLFWILAGLGFFLSSWIVIPAPTMALLPLGVGAPEISPLLVLGNTSILVAALLILPSGGQRLMLLGLIMVAIIVSSLPLTQLPATVASTDQQMQDVFGTDYPERLTLASPNVFRPQPFSLGDLFRGLRDPNGDTAEIEQETRSLPAADGTPLTLNIYRNTSSPQPTEGWPTLVVIYGGAWRVGHPDDTVDFSHTMAARGYAVVAIDYRHAPAHRFPAQPEDVHTSMQWLATHGSAYGLNLKRLALVGWSAGAHLALLSAYQSSPVPVQAVVNYYGPVDLIQGYLDPPVPDPIGTQAVLEDFLGGAPDEQPALYGKASPIQAVRPDLPPTFSVYGDRDHLVKPIFGQQLHEQLQATGNLSVLLTLPWSEHAFDRVFRGLGNQVTLYYVERFLALTLESSNEP